MSNRNTAIGLVGVVTAVLLQTTLFSQLRIFGATPNLVLLVVVAVVRFMEDEPAIFLGFTGGLLADLLGDSPLGLWALSLTVAAFITVRFRRLIEEAPVLIWIGVFGLTLVAEVLFLLLGTLFGQKYLSQVGIARIVLFKAAYTSLLSLAVIPAFNALLAPKRRTLVL